MLHHDELLHIYLPHSNYLQCSTMLHNIRHCCAILSIAQFCTLVHKMVETTLKWCTIIANAPHWSFIAYKSFTMLSNVSELFTMSPTVSNCFSMFPNVSKFFLMFQMFPNVSKRFQTSPNVSKRFQCFQMISNVSKWKRYKV